MPSYLVYLATHSALQRVCIYVLIMHATCDSQMLDDVPAAEKIFENYAL
jgi:uncharacterized membrane protein